MILSNLVWILVTLFVVIAVCYLSKKQGYVTLTALYCTMAVSSAIAATKMISMFGFYVPGGVIIYAASFLITDLISEVYGRQAAVRTVYCGFGSMLIFAGYSLLIIHWEAAPFYMEQTAFEKVVGLSFRITMAGWISFMVSQYWDVIVFHYLKESSRECISRHLWVRNCGSTITSQLIDSTLFIFIAFYGIYDAIWQMIFAQYFVKVIIALLDTPFAYLGRFILASPLNKQSKKLLKATLPL